MAKANLPGAYTHTDRRIYGPGEGDYPDELVQSLKDAGVLTGDGEPSEAQQEGGLFEGLTDDQVATLEAAGYDDEESISAASEEELDALDGIGEATIRKLKERAAGA